jgi:hypothetical protein
LVVLIIIKASQNNEWQLPLLKEVIFEEYRLLGYDAVSRRHIPEDDTLHNHRCENLKSYEVIFVFIAVIRHLIARPAIPWMKPSLC